MEFSKQEKIEKIVEEVKNCKKCELWETRNNPVPGEGSLNSRIMFIGEAPGYNEDKQGRPFVGKAGEILDELLQSVGLEREEVYIANIIKCRPPQNRGPLKTEIKACTDYLDRQIAIIRPEVIVTLGNFALSYIFEKFGLKEEKIGQIHGQVFNITNLTGIKKIIPLYHPAAATYNPQMKTLLLEDFKFIKEVF